MDDLSDMAYQANGLLVIFATGVFVMYLIYQSAASPDVIKSLAYISPWLASNAKTLSWVAIGIVFVITVTIPILMMGSSDGESRLAKFGFVAVGAIFLPIIAFLLSSKLLGAW